MTFMMHNRRIFYYSAIYKKLILSVEKTMYILSVIIVCIGEYLNRFRETGGVIAFTGGKKN